MIIKRRQSSELAGRVTESFAASLALLLRDQFPEARQQPFEELRADVVRLIPRAEAYGIVTEQDLAVYITVAFLLGENFDQEFPAAQEVLTSPVLNAADKTQWLEEWTTELFKTLEPPEN